MDGARLANALATTGDSLADMTLARRRRRLVVRLRQERRPQCRGADPVQDRACRRDRGAPQTRRTFVCRKAAMLAAQIAGDARRWICGSTMHGPRMLLRRRVASAAPHRLVYPVEANEIFLKVSADEAAQLRRRGLRLLRLGTRADPPGHQLGPAGRSPRPARFGDRGSVTGDKPRLISLGARFDWPRHADRPVLSSDR